MAALWNKNIIRFLQWANERFEPNSWNSIWYECFFVSFFKDEKGSRLINGFLSWIAVHFFPFPTHNIFGWITLRHIEKRENFTSRMSEWRTLSFKKHSGLHDVSPAQQLARYNILCVFNHPTKCTKASGRSLKWKEANNAAICDDLITHDVFVSLLFLGAFNCVCLREKLSAVRREQEIRN